MIAQSLEMTQIQAAHVAPSEYVRRLLEVMTYDVPYTTLQLLDALGLKSKETLRRHYLGPALADGLVVMSMPEKPTSRNQRYIKT